MGRQPVRARLGMDYARTPRPEWQAMLDAQHIPGTARLVVAWEAGDAWQPINRWMLWQLQPFSGVIDGELVYFVDKTIREELQGPHPRSQGHYCSDTSQCLCAKKTGRWRGGAARLIDRRAWEIARAYFHETGEWVRPRRLWVIQGEMGGHPFSVGYDEERRRRAIGMTPDVPSAGDLPYAEFDRRVLRALERYDLWRHAHGLGDPMTNAAKLAIAQVRATEMEAHTAQWDALMTLSEEWADGALHAFKQDGLHRLRLNPVGSTTRAVDVERHRHDYIHDYSLEVA